MRHWLPMVFAGLGWGLSAAAAGAMEPRGLLILPEEAKVETDEAAPVVLILPKEVIGQGDGDESTAELYPHVLRRRLGDEDDREAEEPPRLRVRDFLARSIGVMHGNHPTDETKDFLRIMGFSAEPPQEQATFKGDAVFFVPTPPAHIPPPAPEPIPYQDEEVF